MPRITQKQLDWYKNVVKRSEELLDYFNRHEDIDDYIDARNRLREALKPMSDRPTAKELSEVAPSGAVIPLEKCCAMVAVKILKTFKVATDDKSGLYCENKLIDWIEKYEKEIN